MKSPYTDLPPHRFWRSGVSEAHPLTVENLYKKKFALGRSEKIATAGSCFAQHVANHLHDNGFSVMDVEPPPSVLSDEAAKKFGYKIYSARYGNIYTVRQLLQLARDAESGAVDERDVWEKDGRYYDALRPNVEPDGLESVAEALALRRQHLTKVKGLFAQMEIFIFTLGLTEAWIDKRSGRVYPTAPGTIAGDYDPDIFEFHNFSFDEIYGDFVEFIQLVRGYNPNFKVILTVSPVPLTATASDEHVLLATTYSKSLLRAVAGALAKKYNRIDYFPSYEIIASPWSRGFFYEANMRSVSPAGVASVMRVFFAEHGDHDNGKATGKGVATPASQAEDRDGQRAAKFAARREEREQNMQARARGQREERQAAKRAAKHPQQTGKERGITKEDAICEDLLLDAFAPKS